MAIRRPIAFMSYVRSDDEHEFGRITKFRQRLEGEVRMQTGRSFAIFQDRNDIEWGQQWSQMIAQSLADVTFPIPIVTPSFFESPACRDEFNTFLLREKTLGLDRLILPVLYLDCDQLESNSNIENQIAKVLKERNWTDWRPLRFKTFEDERVLAELANMGKMIKATMHELDIIIAKSASVGLQDRELAKVDIPATKSIEITKRSDAYFVPVARPSTRFNKNKYLEARKHDYYAYTRKFDETVNASELADPDELVRLNQFLLRASPGSEYDSNPLTKEISERFKRRSDPPSVSITFLLDNSGSMRGAKIVNVAGAMIVLTEWLDRWQIRSEILGFTTRAWKGGQSREMWLRDNKPSQPGRLNDLRHIVYKSYETPYHISAPSLGIMAREGLLKENIDGEALLWAYARLLQEASTTKIIIFITDGSPVDDSTLSVNAGNFLEKHLISVIEKITSEKRVLLRAIGIEHDVSGYFKGAVTVTEKTQLAESIFEILRSLKL